MIFNKKNYMILRYIYKNNKTTEKTLIKKFGAGASETLVNLIVEGYVIGESNGEFKYHSTDLGDEYVENRKTDSAKFWIPILVSSALSIVALIKSFLPELAGLIRYLLNVSRP